jgi:hypothetical protein
MGGWYLGNAFVAWEIARVWKWSVVHPSVLMLWVFSVLEVVVLIVFNDKLRFDTALGWPYFLILSFAALTAIVCMVDWARLRPAVAVGPGEVSNALAAGLIGFALAVFVIAIFPLLGYGTSGTIFPEPISQFTLRACGCFYFSIAVGTVPLIVRRSLQATIFYARTGLALVYAITAAALLNLDRFDIAVNPGKMVYLGVYLIVGVVVTLFVFRYRERPGRARALSEA